MAGDSGALDIDDVKLRELTMTVGRIKAAIGTLQLDAGGVLKDGFIAVPAEKLARMARVRRWRQLYPVRELVQDLMTELGDAERRLDAQYERLEESLCALGATRPPSEVRTPTKPKA